MPALYIDSGWEVPKLQLHRDQDLRAYRSTFVPAESNRALRACAEFKGDLLIVESERDDIIPPAVITSYREAALQAHSLTYRCIAGADHGLTDDASQRAYTALLTQWLGEMLPSARRGGDSAAATAAAAMQAAAEAVARRAGARSAAERFVKCRRLRPVRSRGRLQTSSVLPAALTCRAAWAPCTSHRLATGRAMAAAAQPSPHRRQGAVPALR